MNLKHRDWAGYVALIGTLLLLVWAVNEVGAF